MKYLITICVAVYNQEELIIKALDSIPRHDDIEVLICDDGSTDNTFKNVEKYKEEHKDLNITLIKNEQNIGLGLTKNVMYDNAQGMYVAELDSDDYLYTDRFELVYNIVKEHTDVDIFYINLVKNDGSQFILSPTSKISLCGGPARIIRREFMENCRCPDVKAGEDWFLNQKLLENNPKEYFTGIAAYHYNFPREGSLFDLMINGKL